MEQWTPFHCGFRRGHWTESAEKSLLLSLLSLFILSFIETIIRNMDQGWLTRAVFIHLRSAYDTVDHELLLQKLCGYGMGATELVWFKDYLSNRTQVVGTSPFSPIPVLCALM